MGTQPQIHSQRSVPEVLRDIAGDIQEIIRSEVRLAKAEIKEEADKAASPVKALGIGILFSFYALGFLFLAGVYGLSTVMAGWLAALLVSVLTGMIALVLISSGKKGLRSVHTVPRRAMESTKESVEWAKDQIK